MEPAKNFRFCQYTFLKHKTWQGQKKQLFNQIKMTVFWIGKSTVVFLSTEFLDKYNLSIQHKVVWYCTVVWYLNYNNELKQRCERSQYTVFQ